MICVISATRERLPDEIIPDSVEHSHTFQDNEENNAAAHTIDLNLSTLSGTSSGSDGKTWLKLKLTELYCIQQVILYRSDGSPSLTWTCSNTDCSTCEGTYCSYYLLTTSSERTSSDDLPLIASCIYGDTVTLERLKSGWIRVSEIAITGKQGEIRYSL